MKVFVVLLLNCLLFSSHFASAQNIVVKNVEELSTANKNAKPGDIIILKNGEWNNSNISLNCSGTKEKPILLKAETAGKVILTGKSSLQLGGNYITVDGLYFTKGYAGDNAVIDFRIDKKQLANFCRVTNTVINDFNNPQRMDENYWISFYGKNNRVDHCSFFNKKNMGVLLAVILEDERSRENFHSIDHNYFGFRLPLASNSGEIIRVGVSQHCEFNSNTQITDNFFEHCDGETEIISLKSCSNAIRGNLFKECQGAVVLRHGHFNTVEDNIFLGNNKEGTGGVRIINRGQWIVNNLFYQCRGTGFRSPLSVMNGVPNSPAFRYVTASDAVVANNSFYECTPVSFCEGADTERSEAPFNIQLLNNIFYNKKDSLLFQVYDKTNGFRFAGNNVAIVAQQDLLPGFIRTPLTLQKTNPVIVPVSDKSYKLDDSLLSLIPSRIKGTLSSTPGFANSKKLLAIEANAYTASGASWFNKSLLVINKKKVQVNCKTAEEVLQQVSKNKQADLTINLTGNLYNFTEPLNITTNTVIQAAQKNAIQFSNSQAGAPFFIQVKAGNNLSLRNINFDLGNVHAAAFITTDTSGSSNHSSIQVINCQVNNLNGTFFNAAKSSVTDSFVVSNSSFKYNKGSIFRFMDETDKKGYYNVEQLKIVNNSFTNNTGQILSMLRGGNDESTMGPSLSFSGNQINNCNTGDNQALIHLYGTQLSLIQGNNFTNSNAGSTLLLFEDIVKAKHVVSKNRFSNSGKILDNKFVESR